jgi:hypothetical protein
MYMDPPTSAIINSGVQSRAIYVSPIPGRHCQVALNPAAVAEAIATPDHRVSMGTVAEVTADFARLIQ